MFIKFFEKFVVQDLTSGGNCCVVSDIDELTEVVEDKGIVFPRGNISELRNALQKCCDDKRLVEQYKREAAEFICKKYDWDKVTEDTLKIYEEKTK